MCPPPALFSLPLVPSLVIFCFIHSISSLFCRHLAACAPRFLSYFISLSFFHHHHHYHYSMKISLDFFYVFFVLVGFYKIYRMQSFHSSLFLLTYSNFSCSIFILFSHIFSQIVSSFSNSFILLLVLYERKGTVLSFCCYCRCRCYCCYSC